MSIIVLVLLWLIEIVGDEGGEPAENPEQQRHEDPRGSTQGREYFKCSKEQKTAVKLTFIADGQSNLERSLFFPKKGAIFCIFVP